MLAGLAPDGGLYVPQSLAAIQRAEIAAFAGKSYADVAYAIICRFAGDTLRRPS